MGKDRDELIRRLGGTPISDLQLTDDEIIKQAWDTYWDRGDIPPWIEECFTAEELVELHNRLNQNIEERNESIKNGGRTQT